MYLHCFNQMAIYLVYYSFLILDCQNDGDCSEVQYCGDDGFCYCKFPYKFGKIHQQTVFAAPLTKIFSKFRLSD